jgi:hypothetical protein
MKHEVVLIILTLSNAIIYHFQKESDYNCSHYTKTLKHNEALNVDISGLSKIETHSDDKICLESTYYYPYVPVSNYHLTNGPQFNIGSNTCSHSIIVEYYICAFKCDWSTYFSKSQIFGKGDIISKVFIGGNKLSKITLHIQDNHCVKGYFKCNRLELSKSNHEMLTTSDQFTFIGKNVCDQLINIMFTVDECQL